MYSSFTPHTNPEVNIFTYEETEALFPIYTNNSWKHGI